MADELPKGMTFDQFSVITAQIQTLDKKLDKMEETVAKRMDKNELAFDGYTRETRTVTEALDRRIQKLEDLRNSLVQIIVIAILVIVVVALLLFILLRPNADRTFQHNAENLSTVLNIYAVLK